MYTRSAKTREALELIMRAFDDCEKGPSGTKPRINQSQWPGLSDGAAYKPWQAGSYQASDSTVDASECESSSGNSGGDSTENCWSGIADPQHVRPAPKSQDTPPTKTPQLWPVPLSRRRAQRTDLSCKEARKMAIQRHSLAETMDSREPLANSSPNAFVAAWAVAEKMGAWQEEGKPKRRNQPSVQKGEQPDHTDAPAKCEDMPLPKWVLPSAAPLSTAPPPQPHDQGACAEAKVGRGGGSVATAFDFVRGGQADKRGIRNAALAARRHFE